MTHELPRILIVDDELDASQNLSDILSDLGFQVDLAHDGPSALERVRQQVYDVAVLDLKMPGMNGVELYRRIKAISSGTIAIVVTAFASSQIAQEALAAGATEIIPKPLDLPRLLQRVEHALRQSLVMIVDDDKDLCDSLWDVLRGHGYRVCIANDAPSARDLLAQRRFQIVLIDMRLPQGNGKDVFEFVRHTHADARTILITGYRSETEQQIAQILQLGANAVAYKPFDIDQLLKTLHELAQVKAQHGTASLASLVEHCRVARLLHSNIHHAPRPANSRRRR